MAKSSLKTMNPLVPIGIIAAVVAAVMIGVFAVADDAPPNEPTIIAEDVNGEPAGSGTTPEGEADMEEDGVTEEQLQEVEPAAGGDIPAQEEAGATDGEGSSDTQAEGESADTGSEDTADRVTEGGEVQADAVESGGADGQQSDDPTPAAAEQDATGSEEDTFLIDESSDNPTEPTAETQESTENADALPEGRDAQTELNPAECQDIVRDTDDGGAAVVPTPSGPNGNIGDCVESAEDSADTETQQ